MNLSQILIILNARVKIFIITFVLTVLTATVVSFLLPKSYKATATLVLNYKGTDPITGMVVPGQLMPGYLATQVDIVQSENVALKVVDQLKLADNELIKQTFYDKNDGAGDIHDWLAELLLNNLSVLPSKESSVLEITFKGKDPDFVAAVANAFAESYQQTSIQLRVEPAQKAASYFGEQTKVFRDNLARAQEKLSKFQQENGITNADSQLDVETNRLNELTSQLVAAQSQSIDASSRNHNSMASAENSPDVAISPVVQNLKVAATNAEAKVADLSERVGRNHPDYQSAMAELTKIRSQLQDETRRTAKAIGGTAQISQQRESELRSEVDKQKIKVLELNRLRDQLALLKQDADTAERDLGVVTQRFSQTNIDAQSNQSDIAILNLAKSPVKPSGPRILLNILLSIFVGGILGVGFSFLAELLDRKVRSRDDIVELLDTKVLAVISPNKAKKKTKRLASAKSDSFVRLLKDSNV